jgi:hypothetical protein
MVMKNQYFFRLMIIVPMEWLMGLVKKLIVNGGEGYL